MAYSLIKQNLQVQFLDDKYTNGKKTKIYQHLKDDADAQHLAEFAGAMRELRADAGVGDLVVVQYQKVENATSDK
jgi:hypothetical protein